MRILDCRISMILFAIARYYSYAHYAITIQYQQCRQRTNYCFLFKILFHTVICIIIDSNLNLFGYCSLKENVVEVLSFDILQSQYRTAMVILNYFHWEQFYLLSCSCKSITNRNFCGIDIASGMCDNCAFSAEVEEVDACGMILGLHYKIGSLLSMRFCLCLNAIDVFKQIIRQ